MGTEDTAGTSREAMKKLIREELSREGKARPVVLTGVAGVGKTWIAKEILKEPESVDLFVSLWVCSNPQDQKEFLMEKIKRQLSIFLISEEWEEFCSMKKGASAGPVKSKILLVVLDGLPDSISDDEIMKDLDDLLKVLDCLSDSMNDAEISKALYYLLVGLDCIPEIRKYLDNFQHDYKDKLLAAERSVKSGRYYRVLVTRRKETGQHGKKFKIEPLSLAEGSDLLKERVGEKVREVAQEIAKKSKGLPSAIVMIAEALKRIAKTDTGTPTSEAALKEAATREEASDGVNPLLRCAYEMLPKSDTALINCWWQSLHVFRRHGGVHFNELIACWILEGCVGSIDRVEQAYRDGHRVLLELIGRCMLKVQYGNIVAMDDLALAVPDYRRDGYEGTSSLGLASVFEGWDWEYFGEITRADGMINIICNRERWAEESKQLHRLRQRIKPLQQTFMQREQTLEKRKGTLEKLEQTLEQLEQREQTLKQPEKTLKQPEKTLKQPEQTPKQPEQTLKQPAKTLKQPEQLKQTLKQLKQTLKQPEQEQTLNQLELEQLKQTLEQVEQTLKQPKQTPEQQEQTLEQLEQKLRQHEPALAFCSPKPGFPYSTPPEKPFWYFTPQKAPKESKARQESKEPQESKARQESKEPQESEEPQEPKELRQACLLVLRGCDPDREGIDIKEFKNLKVLEISGATSLKDDLFGSLTQLRSLNLSETQISSEHSSIFQLCELRWLILRKCSSLGELPRLTKLTNLEVLDLSGASSFKRFKDRILTSLTKLHVLDASQTQIDHLPILGALTTLTRLSLRSCQWLTRLPKLDKLSGLQILDLSGAALLEEIPSLGSTNQLKLLDLSGTGLSHPSFTVDGLTNLESLDLSNTKITSLPSLSRLGNLEVLNLSGCSGFSIENISFGHMTLLRRLNLSGTKIKSLESLSNLVNLRQLLLKNCGSLEGPQSRESLSNLESLSKLEVLDLSGVTILKGAKAEYLNGMTGLRRLDLSETGLELPFPHQLTNLTELSLRGCSLPETEPTLGACTKLEVLDLSGTHVPSLPSSLKGLGSLRELKLRGCSALAELRHLESLTRLEVLDLFGTGIGQVPPGISNLTSLKHLDLPDFKDRTNFDWKSIKLPPEELNWVESGIFDRGEKRPCMLLSHDELSKILKGDPELKGQCFQNFHFFVCLSKKHRVAGEIYRQRVDPFSRKIFSMIFSRPREPKRLLEIVGFDDFPAGVEEAFRKAEHVSIIDNKFIKSLSNLATHLKAMNEGEAAMESCVLDRCEEMLTVFGEKKSGEKKSEARMEENNVSSSNVQLGSFKNLRNLCLECCPLLKYVFASSQLPENLEILQVKFCDELESLFSSNISTECKLPKLKKLHLVELPKLTSILVRPTESVKNSFPSITSITVRECPKLKLSEESSLLKEIRQVPNASIENSKIFEY